jgi:methionine synthase II (cobalamin-independent)
MTEFKRNPPFRAEHLGSLLRPKELLTAHAAFEKNEMSKADITAVEDEVVTKVMKLQTEAGLRAVTDGEYR